MCRLRKLNKPDKTSAPRKTRLLVVVRAPLSPNELPRRIVRSCSWRVRTAPRRRRSVGGEASEGEVQVVDKPANIKKTKWSPKSTKRWSAVIVIRCFGAMRHTNLTAVLKSKTL